MKSLLLAAARRRSSAAAARPGRPLRYFMDARGVAHRHHPDGPVVSMTDSERHPDTGSNEPQISCVSGMTAAVSCGTRHGRALSFLAASFSGPRRVLTFKTS